MKWSTRRRSNAEPCSGRSVGRKTVQRIVDFPSRAYHRARKETVLSLSTREIRLLKVSVKW